LIGVASTIASVSSLFSVIDAELFTDCYCSIGGLVVGFQRRA
jgi:hypothetical protein